MQFSQNMSHDVFQMKMYQIIERCPEVFCIQDDLCVYDKTEKDHDFNLINLMNLPLRAEKVK